MRDLTGASIVRLLRTALALAVALAGAVPALAQAPAAAPAPDARPFHELVDLRPLDSVAVFTEGRLKSFGSFANTQMQFVSGPRKVGGQPADFTYLDLMFRPKAYEGAALLYVKNKQVRARVSDAVPRADPARLRKSRRGPWQYRRERGHPRGSSPPAPPSPRCRPWPAGHRMAPSPQSPAPRPIRPRR